MPTAVGWYEFRLFVNNVRVASERTGRRGCLFESYPALTSVSPSAAVVGGSAFTLRWPATLQILVRRRLEWHGATDDLCEQLAAPGGYRCQRHCDGGNGDHHGYASARGRYVGCVDIHDGPAAISDSQHHECRPRWDSDRHIDRRPRRVRRLARARHDDGAEYELPAIHVARRWGNDHAHVDRHDAGDDRLVRVPTVHEQQLHSHRDGPTVVVAQGTGGNPVPAIGSLSPNSAVTGGAAFTLVVNGSGFVTGSLVRWNRADRPTTFVSSVQVQASIAATDIAVSGTAQGPSSLLCQAAALPRRRHSPSPRLAEHRLFR